MQIRFIAAAIALLCVGACVKMLALGAPASVHDNFASRRGSGRFVGRVWPRIVDASH